MVLIVLQIVSQSSACLQYDGRPPPVGIDRNHQDMIKYRSDEVVSSIRQLAAQILEKSGLVGGRPASTSRSDDAINTLAGTFRNLSTDNGRPSEGSQRRRLPKGEVALA